MNSEIVQTQSWRYKTIVVIKRQQQSTTSNKLGDNCELLLWLLPGLLLFVSADVSCVFSLIKGRRWPYGRRFCSPGVNNSFEESFVLSKRVSK